MKQNKIIKRLRGLFPKINGIQAALLYGSSGRNEAGPNSDIDIQVLTDDIFELKQLMTSLQNEFNTEIRSIRQISLRDKIVVYFTEHPKIEFSLCTSLSEINRNYIGSEIIAVENTILYEKPGSEHQLEEYLRNIIADHNKKKQAGS